MMKRNWKEGQAAGQWIPVLNAAEAQHGIPPGLLARQCYEESRFNPLALNAKSGALGIMQLLPKFFNGAGSNPVKDIDTAAGYMKKLFLDFGDWQLALAAYDWGPGNLRSWMAAGTIFHHLPPETQAYVTDITTDVPVQGTLCKIPSLLIAGAPTNLLSEGPSSAPQLPKSLWQSVTTFLKPRSMALQAAQLPAFASLPLRTSSLIIPTVKESDNMNGPNPALVAAAPALNNVLDAIDQFGKDIGPDPLAWKLTVLPALTKLLGAVELQVPVVLVAEGGQLPGLISARVQTIRAKLAAAIAQPVAEVPVAVASPTQAV